MALALKDFSAFLVLVVFFASEQWIAQACDLSSIVVHETATGEYIEGRPEYVVRLNNNCICEQRNMKVDCKGYDTLEFPSPDILRMIDDKTCLLCDGKAIHYKDSVSFLYAQSKQVSFKPVSSEIHCP